MTARDDTWNIEALEELANEEELDASERLNRIHDVWRARGIEMPGHFPIGERKP